MANTQNYINHLLQNTGITPACSEEERLAAEDIAQIFRNHGFDPEVQEFNAPAPSRLAFAVTGILAFAGALLMGIGGGVGLVGTLLAIAGAVLYVLERMGRPVISRLGKTGVSQNVIAYHKASGPLASPRNRPVVVVAAQGPAVDRSDSRFAGGACQRGKYHCQPFRASLYVWIGVQQVFCCRHAWCYGQRCPLSGGK